MRVILWITGVFVAVVGLSVTAVVISVGVKAATAYDNVGPRALGLAASQLGPDYRYDIRQVNLSPYSMSWSDKNGFVTTSPTITVLVRARKDDEAQFLTFSWNR
jgi:hypothetical protein